MRASSTPMANPSALPDPATEVPGHVARNVETIGALHQRAERRATWHQRAIERLTAAVGRPALFYAVVVGVTAWSLGNGLLHRAGHRVPDPPPFFWLQGVVSLGALLVTTMVLITQNRQAKVAERRAHLDLQVNLLAEQKATKVIALLEELRRDLPGVPERRDSEAERMAASADPHVVARALEETLAPGREGSKPGPSRSD